MYMRNLSLFTLLAVLSSVNGQVARKWLCDCTTQGQPNPALTQQCCTKVQGLFIPNPPPDSVATDGKRYQDAQIPVRVDGLWYPVLKTFQALFGDVTKPRANKLSEEIMDKEAQLMKDLADREENGFRAVTGTF
ncbi:hypothetical protein B0H14DRAFT_2615694 [Mycena olivaceomarginata]|nr:hypothetical protein B0H14DRAFT_2615694 [Mycena olivaceomarginata]